MARTSCAGELVALGVRAVAQGGVGEPDVEVAGPGTGQGVQVASCRRSSDSDPSGRCVSPTRGGGGGHDVEVAGVRRQVVAGALDLDEDADAVCRLRSAGDGSSNCGSWSSGSRARTPGPRGHRRDRRARSRRWSASGGSAQKTVSRMMIGGSAGLRMMIALPRSRAADRLHAVRAVVRVNSSMLARVPGPAERDDDRGDDLGVATPARRATTAATIGIVAWPPQVIMLTFGASEVLRRG